MQSLTIAQQGYLLKGRDLRLDFLRGLVMLVVICVHLDFYSLLSMWLWERIGLVSSAEGFVALSGIVVGIVYKKKLLKSGFIETALKLWRRAGQLYLVNLYIILSILLLSKMPSVNVYDVTHWTNLRSGESFALFPDNATESWSTLFKQALFLQIGPHQFQIIGLYSILMGFAPIPLYALYKDRLSWVLLISWGIFCISAITHYRLTGARFEHAFATLSWQALFFNGMIVGFYHEQVFSFISDIKHKRIILGALVLLVGFMFLALNGPEPLFWPWKPLHYIDSSTFMKIYVALFQKDNIGVGRLLNNILLFMSLFAIVTWNWAFLHKWLGWLLIPIGQATLYVFIWHIYFVIFFNNTPLPGLHDFWINTIIHLSSILMIWLMVKKRFMFSIVPR